MSKMLRRGFVKSMLVGAVACLVPWRCAQAETREEWSEMYTGTGTGPTITLDEVVRLYPTIGRFNDRPFRGLPKGTVRMVTLCVWTISSRRPLRIVPHFKRETMEQASIYGDFDEALRGWRRVGR